MNKENKQDFVRGIEAKFKKMKSRFQSLSDQIKPDSPETGKELKNKYRKLEEKINLLEWRIANFKSSQTSMDLDVKLSFYELLDELNWRFKEVRAATKEKEIWESDDVSQRGKKLICE